MWQSSAGRIALREIPCGETRSYGDLARKIGRPSAVRAVGLSHGSNPIAVIVPATVSSARMAR
jgi:methylated-DNA-[protein]-cysteine S-methyltransferase